MRFAAVTLLYTALAAGAIIGPSARADTAAIAALKDGDMNKLAVLDRPTPAPATGFETGDGESATLGDYAGKIALVNFWATWCAPCRKEMPQLAELQSELGGDDFEVVTIATGPNPPAAMAKFFDGIGVDNLPLNRDPNQALAHDMGVLGLPISVILNREGDEIARLQGDADWASDSAKAILRALIDAPDS